MKKYMFLFFLFFFPISVFADSGKSTIVMDVDSGRVLYEKNVYEKRLIASITKIMTCIVTIENASLDESVQVGDEILEIYGTNLYLNKGEILSIKDLLYGLMLRSGNDAAMVLASHVFDDYDIFIQKMNEKASQLGMKNTIFYNPHGLDDDTQNYSTAYDMALLARYTFYNSTYKKIIATKKYSTKSNLKSYIWYNRMSLLGQYDNCLGGKNGYTPRAGKTLVSYASNRSLNLLIVSLDDFNLYDNHQSLYNQYFNSFRKYTIIEKDDFYIDSSLIHESVYLKDSFSYPLASNEIDDISTVVHFYKDSSNDIVGKIVIKLKNNIIGEIPVYKKQIKKKKNNSFFQKIKRLLI